MSKAYELTTKLVSVKAGDREDLLNALRSISSFDNDFSGENGTEYNWEETNRLGFSSNCEYLIDNVKDIKNDIECINTFIKEWMESDNSYYHSYNVDFIINEEEQVKCISFATICGY